MLRIRLEHAQGRRQAGAAAAAHRRAGVGHGPRPRSRSTPTPRPSGRTRRRSRRARRWRIWPTTWASWDALVELYGEALSAAASWSPSWSASCCWWWRSPTTRSWATREKAVEYFQRAQEIEPEDRLGAGGAGAAVHPHRALARPGRDPAQEGRAGRRRRASASASTSRSPPCGRRPSATPTRPSPPGRTCWATTPAACMALRALDRLFQQRGMDLELADNLQRQLELTEDHDVTVMLLAAWGGCARTSCEDLPGAVETYRRLLELAPGAPRDHRGAGAHPAVARAGAGGGRDARAGLPGAQRLPQPDRGCWRSRPATPRSASSGSPCCRRSPPPTRTAPTIRPAPTRRWPGRWPRTRSTARPSSGIERLARVLGKLGRSGRPLRAHRRRRSPTTSVKRALYHKIATLSEAALGDDERAAAAYLAALDLRRRRPGGGQRPGAHLRPQLGLPAAGRRCYERKMAMVDDVEREEGSWASRRPRSTRRCWRAPSRPSPSTGRSWPSTRATATALEQLERLYIRLARWEDLKDIYTRKADLAADPREKKQMLFVLGQVYDRELGNPEQGHRDLQRHPGHRSRRLRGGAGAGSPVRPDRALVRPAVGAGAADRAVAVGGRGGVAALPHRRAVARAS